PRLLRARRERRWRIFVLRRRKRSRRVRKEKSDRFTRRCRTGWKRVAVTPTSQGSDVGYDGKIPVGKVLQAVKTACRATHQCTTIVHRPRGREGHGGGEPALVRGGEIEHRPIAAPHQALRAEDFHQVVEITPQHVDGPSG